MDVGNGELTEGQQQIKQRFEDEFGFWIEEYDWLLKLDPDFVDMYRELFGHPLREGSLDPKVREFIAIALNVNASQLYEEATRRHIRRAIEEGATVEELIAVLELSTAMGLHSITAGTPMLEEEAGLPREVSPEEQAEQQRVKGKFEESRGYWSEFWDSLLALDHEFLDRYTDYSTYPSRNDVLEPKVREFIWLAIDISTTHLYMTGTRVHIQNALDVGATREEIMEVFELTTVLGGNALTMGIPILIEEARRADILPD